MTKPKGEDVSKKETSKNKLKGKNMENQFQAAAGLVKQEIEISGLSDHILGHDTFGSTNEFPSIIWDTLSSGETEYKQLRVWIKREVDETLVSDLQAMADALPVDSPRKAAWQQIVDKINQQYDGFINPPEWDLP